MLRQRKSARRLLSAIGAAVAAMLAFAAFAANAAQASPTWHIDGKQFLGEEAVAWEGGPVTLTNNGLGLTVKCSTHSKSMNIVYGNTSSGTLIFDGCSATEYEEVCTVKPLELAVSSGLTKVSGVVYEVLKGSGVWTLTGEECPFTGIKLNTSGEFAVAVGPEAVKSTRTFSSQANTANGVAGLHTTAEAEGSPPFNAGSWAISGAGAVSLGAPYKGHQLGVAEGEADTSPPVWRVQGKEFSGEKVVFGIGGPVTLEEKYLGATLTCDSFSSVTTISNRTHDAGEMTFDDCSVAGYEEACTVNPLELEVSGGLAEVSGATYEVFEGSGVWTFNGEECPFAGMNLNTSGKFAVAVGPEALESKRTFSSQANTANGVAGLQTTVEVEGFPPAKAGSWEISGQVKLGFFDSTMFGT